ncbi:hypothetical protein GCM10027299_21810 [Larkinella ripae]
MLETATDVVLRFDELVNGIVSHATRRLPIPDEVLNEVEELKALWAEKWQDYEKERAQERLQTLKKEIADCQHIIRGLRQEVKFINDKYGI